MGVFIPVLLGAGVILSTLAYLVERIARFTAAPVAEHDLADRLATLSPAPRTGSCPRSARRPNLPSRPAAGAPWPLAADGRDPLHRATLWVTVVVVVAGPPSASTCSATPP